MSKNVDAVAPVVAGGALAGLIIEAVPPRARRAVNAWVVGKAAWQIGKGTRNWLRARSAYTITIPGDDDLYEDMKTWLVSTLPDEQRRAVMANSGSTATSGIALESPGAPFVGGPIERRSPAKRTIRLSYDGGAAIKFVLDGHTIEATQGAPERQQWSGAGRVQDYEAYYARQNRLVLSCHSPKARDAVLAHLAMLADRRSEQPEPPRLYIASQWGHWERRAHLRPRSADTVVLAAGLKADLFADLETFLASEHVYAKLGMPWHRGYLFEGPPGAGKTSIAQALATEFDLNVYWVPIRDIPDDATLIRLISEVRAHSVLLLEDIDVLTAAHQRTDDTVDTGTVDRPGPSLQGLLNCLDGMVTPHGLITVSTTNHPDKLDDALLRAGRTDRRFHIGKLYGADAAELIEMLTGERMWVPGSVGVSPATVVNVYKQHIAKHEDAVDAVREWLADQIATNQ